MKKILIVIPSYNEEKSLLKNYQAIIEYNKKHKIKYDVILVNDGSIDNSEKICSENNIPCISLIHNLGIGGAVQTGYKYALSHDYDIVVQFDGDGQHDIRYVKNIIRPIINSDADMVIGSRFLKKDKDSFQSSKMRRIGISIISFFIKLVTGKKIYDTTSGFRAINKKIIYLFAKDYPVEYPEPVSSTKILKMGYKIVEVPVCMKDRVNGVSSLKNMWKQIYYMFNVILSILLVTRGSDK